MPPTGDQLLSIVRILADATSESENLRSNRGMAILPITGSHDAAIHVGHVPWHVEFLGEVFPEASWHDTPRLGIN